MRSLSEFVEKALDQGHSKESIKTELVSAGWDEKSVVDALDHFGEGNLNLAVPRPKATFNARQTFYYLLLFIAMLIGVFSVGRLFYGIIDFVSGVSSYPGASANEVKSAVAYVVIFLPIYGLLLWKEKAWAGVSKNSELCPPKRWVVYLTLLLSSMIVLLKLADLITDLLRGDATFAVVLKALTVILIGTFIFLAHLPVLKKSDV